MSEAYSVVIPAYNSARTIEACLASVVAQTLTPLQVLVIDDASSDGTEAAVRRVESKLTQAGIRLDYFRLPKNAGPSVARNKGIQEARGSFVAFLDADDTWATRKLEIVDQYLCNSNVGLVCHAYTEDNACDRDVRTASYAIRKLSPWKMLLRNPAQTSCAVVRRQPALAFDESMRYCEDYDLWLRIAEHCPAMRLVGDPLTRLGRPQLSPGGLSGDTVRMRIGEARVYYNFCNRDLVSRVWFLPGLMLLSVLKHTYSWLRRSFR